MLLGSTARNINSLTIGITIIVILGLTESSMFTVTNLLLTLVSFYTLNILGNWMTLHRYYSHKSFVFKNNTLKWLFTVLAILAGRGSPLGWVYLHRKHHMYSDTESDPHSPKYLGYKLFGFGHYKRQEEQPMQVFIIKDLMTKEHLFIHNWYMAIILVFAVMLSFISIQLLYFAWILPVFLVHLSQLNFNYFGHISGYRNFDTADNSRNNKWFFPIILGEAWHNNHHANPKNCSTSVKRNEYDPLMKIIAMVIK